MVQPGIDVVVFLNDIPIAGQQGATLNQSMQAINITNQINAEWAERIPGLRYWNIQCNGMYVVSADALQALEDAFLNNSELNIKVAFGNQHFIGKAILVDFPLNTVYQAQFKYSLRLLGVGELKLES